MTNRLSSLLHDEADTLDVPAPRAPEVLAQGHRLRLRRRLTTGAAAIAVLGAVMGGAVAVQSLGDGSNNGRGVTSVPDQGEGPVFAIGTTVYLDGGETTATVDDKAIKNLYYTSVGTLVAHGDNTGREGTARFTLVRDDGSVQPLDVTFEETVPSTDPTQPYLAYAQVTDGTIEVVVLDVTSNTEVARVPVPGDFSWGAWPAPPVSLDGDNVYVGTNDVLRVVDWRTGQIEKTTTIRPGYPIVRGGRSVESAVRPGAPRADGYELTVVDVATGQVLLTPTLPVKADVYPTLRLSRDGRYAALSTMDSGGELGPVEVYDVDTGSHISLDSEFFSSGWSPGNQLFVVEGKSLTTCEPATGECTTSQLTLDVVEGNAQNYSDNLVLGGMTYE